VPRRSRQGGVGNELYPRRSGGTDHARRAGGEPRHCQSLQPVFQLQLVAASTMLQTFFQALLEVLKWNALSFMLIGIVVGFWVGLLPGIGGATTLALMLPFVSRMAPVQAFPFLLGMHAAAATPGETPSFLFGIPGGAASYLH